MNDLVDIHSPRATLISLVLDHVNTPTPAALHETFAPAEAHRLLRTLDSHYTPKHGSWLKMAEVELAAVSTQGLNRRLPDPAALGRTRGAWATRRKTAKATAHWRFTTSKARRKVKPWYPA